MTWQPDEDESWSDGEEEDEEKAAEKGGILNSVRMIAMISLALVAVAMVSSLLVRLWQAVGQLAE